jgi:hypothetical protein
MQKRATEIVPAAISNGLHNSWGITVQFKNGDLGVIYTQDDSSAVNCAGCYIKMRRSKNGGATWGNEKIVYYDGQYDCQAVAGGVTQSGRLVVFFTRVAGAPGGTSTLCLDQGYVYSDDDGAHWTTYTIVPAIMQGGAPATAFSFYGRLLAIDGGKLMIGYWADLGNTMQVAVLFSCDDGETWGDQVIAANSPSVYYDETSFCYLGSGLIIGLSRNQSGGYAGYRQLISQNNGASFTDQGAVTFDTWTDPDSSPAWLEPFQDLDGRLTVAAYFMNRSAEKLKVVLGQNLWNGPSGWINSTLTVLATVASGTGAWSGYPSVVHPNEGPYGFGWFYSAPAASRVVTNIQFFNNPQTRTSPV